MAGHEDEEWMVAKFTTERKAREYLKKSKLKNQTWNKKFRAKSLLGGLDGAWIREEEETIEPIIDPDF